MLVEGITTDSRSDEEKRERIRVGLETPEAQGAWDDIMAVQEAAWVRQSLAEKAARAAGETVMSDAISA